MRLYLADEIHRYLNHDQKRGTAENKRNRQLGNQNFRQNAERGQISGAEHGQAGKDIVKIFGRVFARTDAGDKTAVFFQIVSRFFRIEHNRGVEKGKEDDQTGIKRQIKRLTVSQKLT